MIKDTISIVDYRIISVSPNEWAVLRRVESNHDVDGLIESLTEQRTWSFYYMCERFTNLESATIALLKIAKKECGDYSKVNHKVLIKDKIIFIHVPEVSVESEIKINPKIIKFFQ